MHSSVLLVLLRRPKAESQPLSAGNIIADPRASIHILDFETGDSLQMSGRCHILWEERELPGAERTIEFVTQKWVHIRNALPFEAPGKVKWSPYNPAATQKYTEGAQKVSNTLAQGLSDRDGPF